MVALAAAPGLLAGIYIFAASFFGLTLDQLGAKAVLMHFGIFALAIPLAVVDRWHARVLNPFRGKPLWALRSTQILFLIFVGLFVTFLVMSHVASPEVIKGDYVLNDHGRIVAHISERDYLSLKGWELRLFAAGWMLSYYAVIIQWWFPRQDEWTVAMPD